MDRREREAFEERRAEVWRRAHALFGGEARCWYCGESLTDRWQIDHQTPRQQGGTHNPVNLVAACVRCNVSKNARTVEEYRRTLVRRWRRDLLCAVAALERMAFWYGPDPARDALSLELERRVGFLDEMGECRLRFAGEREAEP